MLPDFPSVYVEPSYRRADPPGQELSGVRLSACSRAHGTSRPLAGDGELIAIGEAVLSNLYHPIVVL